MPLKNLFNLTNLTLLVALALSTVAAYYSIIGLTAIFAGAVIPVIIMGSILELGKITTTVWLKKYWNRCGLVLKLYLVPAVVALAILTSMGIFGFLSKAHMDSGLVSGDVQAKLSLIDEKIKTERDNIDIARKALQQMDAQVDARLSRGDSEAGAERAVQIRRQQAGERVKLQKEIGEAQKKIATLNEERAPIAAENRKVEAEVGPIKYVASLIYGDNPDSNLLERAVRWVIILLVVVFDPLAIALVVAANSSKDWDKVVDDDKVAVNTVLPKDEDTKPLTKEEADALKALDNPIVPWPTEWKDIDTEKVADEIFKEIEKEEIKSQEVDYSKHSYLQNGFGNPHPPGVEPVKPLVYKPEVLTATETIEPSKKVEENIQHKLEVIHKLHQPTENVAEVKPKKERKPRKKKVDTEPEPAPIAQVEPPKQIITEGITSLNPVREINEDYVSFEGRQIRKSALKELRPDLFMLTADPIKRNSTNFGIQFPRLANKGDIFVRVDILPNKAYKFDGSKWIEINKDTSSSYLYNKNYIQYLVEKIDNGEYDIDLLTDNERQQIEEYLKSQQG